MRQIDVARRKGFRLFGCNRTFLDVPDLEVLHGCNSEFWDYYHRDIRNAQLDTGYPKECWTTRPGLEQKYDGLTYFPEKDKPGLAVPGTGEPLHHGHSTGYQLVGLAWMLGAKRIVLLGYDMKFASDYDGRSRKTGSTPRHYFGEYPEPLQHWPSVKVEDGVHVELIEYYQSIADQIERDDLDLEIINCSPDTALDMFPQMPIEDVGDYAPGTKLEDVKRGSDFL